MAASQPSRRDDKCRRCLFKSKKSIAIFILLLYGTLQFILMYLYYLRPKVTIYPVTILGMEDVWNSHRHPTDANNDNTSMWQYYYARQRQNIIVTVVTNNTPVEKTNTSVTKMIKTSNDSRHHDNNSSSLLRPHPHMGARDANGTWGYAADPYAVRRHMRQQRQSAAASSATNATTNLSNDDIIDRYLPLTNAELDGHVCGLPLGKGDEFLSGPLLIDKVVIGGGDPTVPPVAERHPDETFDESKAHLTRVGEPPRVLCVVYTIESNHDRIRAIGETWGHRCDGFLAASTKTVPEIGAVDIPHEGVESYLNMWQKTRSIWAYVHDNYLDDFDFFHLGGDDMHLIVENMRYYLWGMMGNRTNDDDYPLFLGMRVPYVFRNAIPRPPNSTKQEQKKRKKKKRKRRRGGRYNLSGAPGYTLNRRALSMFTNDVLPWCRKHARVSFEDRFFSECMESIDIVGNDTTDARNEQRYLHIPPMFAYKGPRFSDEYNNMILDYWQKVRGGGRKRHMEASSSQVVAWHWFKGGEKMKRHHAILYRSCPEGTALADSIGR